MRVLITTCLLVSSLSLPFIAAASEPEVTARLLVSKLSPYAGEEVDLLLEVTYSGHPGGQTRFNWPQLDNFVVEDLTTVRSLRSRDEKTRLVETIIRRIKPLTAGTFILRNASVLTGKQKITLQPLTLRVQPLPTTGRPDKFIDQVGTYQLMLAASGSGPREISLHIYDSNRLAAVPEIQTWPGPGEQLISIDNKTRAAGARGREHILRYFYVPAAGEKGRLRFSLSVYDPQLQRYLEVKTGATAKPTPGPIMIFILSGLVLVAIGLALFRRWQRPRTISGCLHRLCRRSVTGLSREKIMLLLQSHLDQDELNALQRYWQNSDAHNFDRIQPVAEVNNKLSIGQLRRSLWKNIDKQQNIP